MRGRFNSISNIRSRLRHPFLFALPPMGTSPSPYAASALAGEAHPFSKMLEVTAVSVKEVHHQLEPVVIDFSVSNVSKKAITLLHKISTTPYASPYLTYDIIVTNKITPLDFLPRTRYRESLGLVTGEKVTTFKPGQHDFRDRIIANLVFDMTTPGEYTIIVGFPYRFRENANEVGYASSNPVIVRVLNRLS
jgi:hypothetical protein